MKVDTLTFSLLRFYYSALKVIDVGSLVKETWFVNKLDLQNFLSKQNAAIGIFDSGIGGLTIAKEINNGTS